MKALTCFLGIMAMVAVRSASAAVFSDDFNDGIQSAFWRSITVVAGSGPSVNESGGKLVVDIPGTSTRDPVNGAVAMYQSICRLSGDFSLQVDYEAVLPAVAAGSTLFVWDATTFELLGGVNRSAGFYTVFRSFGTATSVPTTDTAGTLVLQRVGATASGFYNNGGGNVAIGSIAFPTQDVVVGLIGVVSAAAPPGTAMHVEFDNFSGSGSIICSQNLLCGDGATQTGVGGEQCDDGNTVAGDGCCGCRTEPLVPVDVAGLWQLNVSCPGAAVVSQPVSLVQTPGTADVGLAFGPNCGTFFGSDGQIRAITSCYLGAVSAQVCGNTFASPWAGQASVSSNNITFPPFSSNLGTCGNLAHIQVASRLDGDITADGSNRAIRITGTQRLSAVSLFNSGEVNPCFTTTDAFCGFEMRRNSASPGMNVTVEPLPGVTITFLQVYDETQVVVTVQTAAVGTLPANFQVVANGSGGVYLDIEPLGSYAAGPGAVTVCLPYADVNPADGIVDGTTVDEDDLKILHEEGGTFIDRTSSRDPVNNRICASVGTFSQFALGAGSAPTLPSLCGPTPQAGCRGTTRPGGASLALKDKASADQITFKWSGEATTKADFGDPLATTDYQLCVYDRIAGTPISAMGTTAPAGGSCGGAACWQDKSTGFSYRDLAATPDGLLQLQLKAGGAGKAKITLKGKSSLVHLSPLPLTQDPTVTVQLLSSSGVCWEADFSTASKNDPGQFKAKSD